MRHRMSRRRPSTARAYTSGIEAVAKYVEEKSDGNFTIKIHLGEAISPVKENLDGLRIGAFEAAQTCNSYSPGKTPLMGVLDLPFLPMPRDRKSTRLNSSHSCASRLPSSA